MALPRLEPGIALFLMYAWTKRERKGAEHCRKKIIGPLRDMAKAPPIVVDMCGSPPTQAILMECREVLALHCRTCGACERWREDP